MKTRYTYRYTFLFGRGKEMIIKGELFHGEFLERENRFIARVLINGEVTYAHVPNTGRMTELLLKGARVILRKVYGTHRKTQYELLMVYKGSTLTCIDSRLPNELIYNEIKSGNINDFSCFTVLKREVLYKNSRFDIVFADKNRTTLIEIKSVNLFNNRIAMFPDAPTERGRKHLRELMDAKNEGINGAVFFIVLCEDVDIFTPNDRMDPLFGKFLREANSAGIMLRAYSCKISPDNVELRKELKVVL